MKISKIIIKNMFGTELQEIGDKDYLLAGTNGVGKSSVLDAIATALTNKSDRQYKVNKNAEEGRVTIYCNDDTVIDRKFKPNGTAPVTVLRNGKDKVGSPSSFLSNIITPMQMNPIKFLELSSGEQNTTILSSIKFAWDMNTIQKWFGEIPNGVNWNDNILSILSFLGSEKSPWYLERRNCNVKAKALQAVVADAKNALPASYNADEWRNASTQALWAKVSEINRMNRVVESAKSSLAAMDAQYAQAEADRDKKIATTEFQIAVAEKHCDEEIAKLREQIAEIEKKISEVEVRKNNISVTRQSEIEKIGIQYENTVKTLDANKKQYEEIVSQVVESAEPYEAEAKHIDDMRQYISSYDRMVEQEEQLADLTAESEHYTALLELARTTIPAEILANSELPVEGMTVENGTALINGLPIANLSDGEKLKLCVEIALANTSGLQIVLIDGLERLSTENRDALLQECKAKGVQFIGTQTTNDNELMVYEM